MRSLARPAEAGIAAPTCIVCLPGAYQGPEDFLSAGFAAHVYHRALPVDLLFLDPELAHLGDRSFQARLKHDIVEPARALGCRFLWLAGISLGGFMALDYVASNPGDVNGVCLLAPYLGNRAAEFAARAQGLLAMSDEERRIWRFIQARPTGSPVLYLGYGREDRFADAHALMARALPSSAVDVVPGGHDWRTWTLLWENFLDSTFA